MEIRFALMSNHFVLTNDDGIDAPGLRSLQAAVERIAKTVIIAPAESWSSKGHAVTTGAPIQVEPQGSLRFAVNGTPADCVRLALDHLASNPSMVVSGINRGGNLGVDVFHSGTVAAAREATLHGVPAVAISHYVRRELPLDWDRATDLVSRILGFLLGQPISPGSFWNVNLPHLPEGSVDPEIAICGLDPSPLPLQFDRVGDQATYAGSYRGRQRTPGSDVSNCFEGRITITRVRVFEADLVETDDHPQILPVP